MGSRRRLVEVQPIAEVVISRNQLQLSFQEENGGVLLASFVVVVLLSKVTMNTQRFGLLSW